MATDTACKTGTDYQRARCRALRDDVIQPQESRELRGIAAARIEKAQNPNGTLMKYGGDLFDLGPKAANQVVREKLEGFQGHDGWVAFSKRNTELSKQAAPKLQKHVTENASGLPKAFAAIASDPSITYETVDSPEFFPTIPGGVFLTDNASDAYYIAVPMFSDQYPDAESAQKALVKTIAETPSLAYYKFLGYEAVLVKRPPS